MKNKNNGLIFSSKYYTDNERQSCIFMQIQTVT